MSKALRSNWKRHSLTILLVLFSVLSGYGQATNVVFPRVGGPNDFWHTGGMLTSDVNFRFPSKDTVIRYYDSTGIAKFVRGKLYIHLGTGKSWVMIPDSAYVDSLIDAGGGGGGGGYSAGAWLGQSGNVFYFDTANKKATTLTNADNFHFITPLAVLNADNTLYSQLSGMVDSVAYLDSVRLADSVIQRVPYTGATDSVRLGEHPIRAGQFRFDLTPTAPTVIGGMYWNTTNLSPSIPLNANVTLDMGQELYVRGRNNTGTTLPKGAVVYVNGGQGNSPTIANAKADSVNMSAYIIGVTDESISDNATGFVNETGVVTGINTSSWATGDRIYLDTANGQMTNHPPVSPHIQVCIGTALNSTVNGSVLVKPSQPLATDTLMNSGVNIAPTQYAVKRYVTNSISGKMNYTDTAGLSARINTKQAYSDTSIWDATRAWVTGQIPSVTGYVPYSGAVNNLNMGNYGVTAKHVNTDTLEPTSSAGLHLHNTSHQDIFIAGAGGGQNLTIYAPTNVTALINQNETDTVVGSSSTGLLKKIGIATTYLKKADTASLSARIDAKGNGTVTSIQVVGGTGATVTPTTAVTTSGVYTVTPDVSAATFNTLTNKRITYRTGGAASYTTSVTIASDSVDMFVITAQAGALLFNQPSGTPTQGQMLLIRIKDNGTARALTWNAIWRSGDVTLPTTTTINKTLYMEFLYNTTDSKWDIVGKSDNY